MTWRFVVFKFAMGVMLCVAAFCLTVSAFQDFNVNCDDGPGTGLSCPMSLGTEAKVSGPAQVKIISGTPFMVRVTTKGSVSEPEGIKANGWDYTTELTTDGPVTILMTLDGSDAILTPDILVNSLDEQNYPSLSVRRTGYSFAQQIWRSSLPGMLFFCLIILILGVLLIAMGVKEGL